jgi:hypothetical protein
VLIAGEPRCAGSGDDSVAGLGRVAWSHSSRIPYPSGRSSSSSFIGSDSLSMAWCHWCPL